jgi:hypothetical protein
MIPGLDEMIHLETARILHFYPEFQLNFEEIDDLNLPSLPKLRKASDSGLVWESYQRSASHHFGCTLYVAMHSYRDIERIGILYSGQTM